LPPGTNWDNEKMLPPGAKWDNEKNVAARGIIARYMWPLWGHGQCKFVSGHKKRGYLFR